MSKELIAYCGLYCGACSFKLAYDENDKEHINHMPSKYEKFRNTPLEFCSGCKLENKCGDCNIRDCAISKNLNDCSQCNEFPCTKIKKFNDDGIAHHGEAIKNLKLLQKIGKEKSGYGKKIEDCNIIPVILDLINEEDIEKYINKVSKRKRQTAVAVRLHTQAYKQGAVMSYSDTAAIMRLSPSTVGSYIREFEKETGESVPRRGNVHDLGPTLTHKRQICMKHLIQGKSVEQTARETFHSAAAVVRYANDYKRVYTCLKGGWDLNKIKTATGLSESLTKEYIDLIEENSMN